MVRLTWFMLACLLVGLTTGPAAADEAAVLREKPVAALIDATQHPATALLEAKLLNSGQARWVERNEVQRVIAEQQLQAAFGAQGVKQRASLGRLLKADVLVLTREVKSLKQKGASAIDCVICETSQGLRLKTVTLESHGDHEAAADQLSKAVSQGLAKHAERIEIVLAVPPFMSDDLGLEKNYLQSAYAKLAEQELLGRPGLLLLELQEAQAIARELTLDVAADRPGRPNVPWYLLGRYRHEGVGRRQRLRIALQLMQGEKQVAERRQEELEPAGAGEWIRSATADILTNIRRLPDANLPAANSAEVDAKRLAEQGRQFQQVGNWNESLALYEASLLLDPSAPEVRVSAIEATAALMKSIERSYRHGDWIPPMVAAYERGLEHLEIWLRTAPELAGSLKPGTHYNFAMNLEMAFPRELANGSKAWSEHESLVKDCILRRRETYLRIANFRAQDKRTDFGQNWAWDTQAVSLLSAKERYALILRLAEDWGDLPNLHERISRMAFADGIYGRNDSAERDEFIKRLKASDALQWKIAANTIEERLALGKMHAERHRPIVTPATEVKFDPKLIELKLGETNQVGQQFSPQFAIPGEAGISYLLGYSALYRMEQTGELKPIYQRDLDQASIASVVFDGRYVWIVRKPRDEPAALIAVNPKTKRQYFFTSDDGLPTAEESHVTAGRAHTMVLSPLGPGNVCVAGFSGRSWVATASIDGQGGRQVDVFFEAREAETTDAAQRGRPGVVFYPTSAFTLKEPGDGKGRRVLVRRDYVLQAGLRNPLLVDPIGKTVEAASYELYDLPVADNATSDEGTLYVSEHHFSDHPRLMRIKYPGTTKENFVPKLPYGQLAVDTRGVHIVGRHWSVVNLNSGELKTEVEQPGWHYRAPVSTIKEAESPEARTISENGYRLERLLSASPHGVIAVLRNRDGERLFKLEADNEDQSAGQ